MPKSRQTLPQMKPKAGSFLLSSQMMPMAVHSPNTRAFMTGFDIVFPSLGCAEFYVQGGFHLATAELVGERAWPGLKNKKECFHYTLVLPLA